MTAGAGSSGVTRSGFMDLSLGKIEIRNVTCHAVIQRQRDVSHPEQRGH